MKIKVKDWFIFLLLAAAGLLFWCKFEYPRFSYLDLSVDRQKALSVAETYLKAKGVDTSSYSKAVIFEADEWFNRYTQSTLGSKGQQDFIQQYDYDLFFWEVRFFRELQKEEYIFEISPRTAKIINCKHLITEIEPRADLGKNASRQLAENFLKTNYGFSLEAYDFHEEKTKRYDKRTDYKFSWGKKSVYIPWGQNQGAAKLLVGVTVSGNEIREYYYNRLDVPENFQRYVENQLILGRYLFNFYFMMLAALVMFSVNILVKRRYDVIIRLVKKWFCYLAAVVAIVNLADIFNNMQDAIMFYPTSTPLASFLGLYISRAVLSNIFLVIGFIIPALAGESLFKELFPQNKFGSFSPYIMSNFFNRRLSRAIMLGYLVVLVLLGLQAGIFYLGQKYLGVWREWLKLTQFSSAYLPLLGAFIVGLTASFNEEITFRLFGITLIRKYLKNSITAVVLTSFIWGLGHCAYAIFPVWFRIIEVSLLGCVMGFIFLRYGIIPLIVAHYLFDVFWGASAYILGQSLPHLFFGSLILLSIPLAFALIAYFLNKGDKEKDLKTVLSEIQKYNLDILFAFVAEKKSKGYASCAVKEELVRHNWDPLLVNMAIEEVFK